MQVYVAVLHPQGSMGGFEWFVDEDAANEWADKLGRDLVLGITPLHVEDGSNDEITDEIDSRLLDIERRFGYEPPN